jgi:hypothetical protein
VAPRVVERDGDDEGVRAGRRVEGGGSEGRQMGQLSMKRL